MDSSIEWKTPGDCGFRGLKKRRSNCRAAPEALQEREEDFFTVIATGNVSTLRQFLKKHRKQDGSLDFDVNCVNFQNDSAMTVAVDKGNLEMIKCLVQVMNVTKNSILLKAIKRGDLDLVKGLCESLNADEEALDNNFKVSVGETDYPDCVTPIIVAAIHGHYEIVGYLVDRCHKIGDPHKPDCMCEESCQTVLAVSDPLYLASSTYRTYSAMSSPAYIPYATADPINYCFQLHRRLQLLSRTNPSFRDCYKSLAEEVSQFAASLVSECHTSREVELVLRQSQTSQKNTVPSEYPRLHMAMDFNQIEFITQSKVQLVLQRKFYGRFEDWTYYSNSQKFYYIFVRILTAPLAYISFLANPKSEKSNYYASPLNKMLHFLGMYLVFLVLLLLETREPKPSEHMLYNMNSIWSFFIFLYFCSFTGLLAYQILNTGLKSFLRQAWNVYDLAMAAMFSFFVAFSIASMVHVRMLQPQVIISERKYWSTFDPQLLAEGFLVIATLMAYLKLLFFLQLHRILGPLQVALYQMVKCLAWFALFVAVVLLGYSVALSHFYSYYSGMSFVDPDTKDKSTQEESFTDVLSSFKTFFWGLFGQSHSSAADVVLENDNEHMFTELVGYAAFGSFLVLMILVFKSMLIAVAVKCRQRRDMHKIWLFKRTQVFLYFIDLPLLPPPFNLLPHRFGASNSKYDPETATVTESMANIHGSCNKDRNLREDYMKLTKALVERYFTTKLKNKERLRTTDPGTKGEDASKNCQRSRCRSL